MKKYGRYEVRKKLGGGGMGVVYLAYDPRLGREVAIKVISGHLSGKNQSRQRFYREARAMASLNHAGIVPIHDVNEQDGQPYLVMRFMRGGSLTELLYKKGRFTLAEVIPLFERLAPALDMAHARGVVHRDLKPDNILLDEFGHPAISDFGLVKLLSTSMPTTTGRLMGTPHYMSPEQGRGESDIDHRTDIYALGIILFQLLTGKWPYKSTNPYGFIYLHNSEPIPQICALNADLPAECQQIINNVLAKEPEERYNSVAELVAALKKLRQSNEIEYVKRGHLFYQQKEYMSAITEYTNAIHKRPDYADAYMSRGNAYYQSGEYGLAIDDYNQTLQVRPNYAAGYYWRGRAKQEQAKVQEAIADYEKALQINPNYAGAYYQRGLVLQEMRQLDFALADYEAALRIHPKHLKAKTAQQAVLQQIKEAQAREEARKREAQRKRKEEEERKREAQRKRKEEEARRRKEEAERKRKEQEVRRLAEAERRRKEEEARQREEQRMKALLKDDAALKRLPKADQIKIYVNLFRNESLQEAIPAKRRAQLGIELAKLGDPRPEVMTIDGMEFCYVPPGPIWMGSNDAGNKKNKPLHKVDIDYGYWIGRYPVTNAQYQAFVEDGGYRNPAFWTEAKAQGYWKDGKTKDWGNWHDAPRDYRTPFSLPNHPRVGITWYEALAFTRWLSQTWPGTRLPSEAEWEKAARGGIEIPVTPLIRPATNFAPFSSLRLTSNPLGQRHYPWGDDRFGKVKASFDANLTNCKESGIGHSNAVGVFSMAKSPYGVEEMSGNVWEWCQSQWKNYNYSPNDGRERLDVYAPRVFRGGSYYQNKVRAYCFFRYGNYPYLGDDLRGFRVFRP